MTNKHLQRTSVSSFARAIESARSHPIIWLATAGLLLGLPAYAAFQDVFDDSGRSEASDLQMRLEPVDVGVVSYVVPASAPWASLPSAMAASCTPAQRQWLADHGAERRTKWLITLTSSAMGAANSLPVSNFRLEGETVHEAPFQGAVVLVNCPSAGLADWFELSLDMSRPGIEGSVTTSTDSTPRPLTINLMPGERSEGQITLVSQSGFRGVIVADTGGVNNVGIAESRSIEVAASVGGLVRVVPYLADTLQCEMLDDGVGTSGYFSCDEDIIRSAASGGSPP